MPPVREGSLAVPGGMPEALPRRGGRRILVPPAPQRAPRRSYFSSGTISNQNFLCVSSGVSRVTSFESFFIPLSTA